MAVLMADLTADLFFLVQGDHGRLVLSCDLVRRLHFQDCLRGALLVNILARYLHLYIRLPKYRLLVQVLG